MPEDKGTVLGNIHGDGIKGGITFVEQGQLTQLLSDDKKHRDFFVETYTYYLVALVLAGKSIFCGGGLGFVNLFFIGSSDYSFLPKPKDKDDEVREKKEKEYRQYAQERCKDIIDVYHGSKNSQRDSLDYEDIVGTLRMAAFKAVDAFLNRMQDEVRKRQFIENLRNNPDKQRYTGTTIRKTLQIAFWNELQSCFDKGILGFRKTEGKNGYYIYVPHSASRNDPTVLLENTNQEGEFVLPEGQPYRNDFKELDATEKEKQGQRRAAAKEACGKNNLKRDAWDIRRYRIYLVKEVGGAVHRRLPHLSPMKCYALYYNLCDQNPFLNLIHDHETRERYRQSARWSEQMIADLFKLDTNIPEKERAQYSRENVRNYRNAYEKELVNWLRKNVPGLTHSAATALVSADNLRFESLALPFSHLIGISREDLIDLSEEKRLELLKDAYSEFVKNQRTLKDELQ